MARLPIQCREEFKSLFIKFVDTEFSQIQENFEIVKTYDESEWTNNFNTLSTDIVTGLAGYPTDIFGQPFQYGGVETIKSLSFNDKILETYINVSPINKFDNGKDFQIYNIEISKIEQINLTIRQDSEGSNLLNDFIGDYVYILNGSPKSMSISKNYHPLRGIFTKKTDMDLYLTNFFSRLDVLLKRIWGRR